MDRVSTFNGHSTLLSNLMRAEARQAQAQAEVSTGKRATDSRGFGSDAQAITSARTLKTRIDGFVRAAGMLENRLAAQDLALMQVSDATQRARAAVAGAIAAGRADGLMAALNGYFGQAVEGLNAQHGGAYLFAGGQSTTAPVSVRSLDELAAAPSTADVFENDKLVPTHKLDESGVVQTGFLADEIAGPLFEVFSQLQAFAAGPDGPLEGHLTEGQAAFLQGLLAPLDAAYAGVTEVTAQNGLLQTCAEAALATQTERQDMLEGLIGEMAGVDMAEALSKLSQAQTAVQASAQVFATLKDASLLDLLR